MKFLILVLSSVAVSTMPLIQEIGQAHFQHLYGARFSGDSSKFVVAQEQDFSEWIKAHGKTYVSDAEREARFVIFQANSWLVQAIQFLELGSAIYGVKGPFADMSPAEFQKLYRNFNMSMVAIPVEKATIPNIRAPADVDWRTKDAVTSVKNQQHCGACWAFATTGNIEGQWAINKGHLISLSEQELVDCDHMDHGCNGGLPSNAFDVIKELGGLVKESDYPYTAQSGTCKFNQSQVVVKIAGSLAISSNEDDMAVWCASNGPIAIGINSNNMQFYLGGIAEPSNYSCNPSNLDHGVLITGYGVHNNVQYWTMKNSWGQSWGEEGYYRVARGVGACGLNKLPVSAKV